jgi:hypothetical protein
MLPPGRALRAVLLSPLLDHHDIHAAGPHSPLLQDVKLARAVAWALFGKKFLALAGLRSDDSGIWSATLSQ